MQSDRSRTHIATGINGNSENAATATIIGVGAQGIHHRKAALENLRMVVERLMVVSATETVSDTSQSDRILERLDRSIERVVLQRQDPISGLLPASTAHTVHGDYGDAWVRDCVYSCLLYTSPSPRDISGSRMPSSA